MDRLIPDLSAGFDDPLGLLRACHQRILNRCDTLERMCAHLSTQGADRDFRTAAQAVLEYFSSAARHHHQDEEQDLLPRLQGADASLDSLIAQLREEHEQLDSHWATLEPMLARPQADIDTHTFTARVERFITLQRQHIERENRDLLPVAAQHLSATDLASLGRAMAARREG